MENLNLCVEGTIIHSIPRDDINVDYDSLTAKLLNKIIHFDWLTEFQTGEYVKDLYFKQRYMAECAYLLWRYYLKQSNKNFL